MTVHLALRFTCAAALLMSATGCDRLGAQPQTDVVLVDTSGSVSPEDREIYGRTISAVGSGLTAGARLLVAHIGDASRSDFRPVLDVRVERSDVRLEQEDHVRKAEAEVAAAIPTLLPTGAVKRARSTRILDAIAAASQAFGAAENDGDRLFILSDGIEESPAVNLARLAADGEAIEAALEAARKQDLLPNLAGVKIYLIGAGGDDTQLGAGGIKAFWEAYAAATGATLVQIGRLPYSPAD